LLLRKSGRRIGQAAVPEQGASELKLSKVVLARQRAVPPHHKRRSFAKRWTAIDTHAQLFKSYYNPRRKRGSLKGKTPAQEAGLTDYK
jgi:transposase InsO family protein